MTFADAITRLESALHIELPGAAGQARMAPVPRREWPKGFNIARVRHAAGLLLVFPAAENDEASPSSQSSQSAQSSRPSRSLRPLRSRSDAHVVLTVRGETPRHAGQVSLPGGVVEPGETFEQAALREAHEEIALDASQVRVLGALTPLDIPVSGFRLYPIVAASETRPHLRPADGEVAHILEVAIEDLLDARAVRHTTREREGIELTVPAFHVASHEIWGATAMVIA
ncbi:MAG TPA: CoA pyrophosphatase, partial [Vicinamibacterales bacterium]|nr:CoA pyrophosphatase [Vicinamibacterales bacterium]